MDGVRRAREIFEQALEMALESDRMAFVGRECGGNEGLRREVEELLQAHAEAGAFMASEEMGPAVGWPVGVRWAGRDWQEELEGQVWGRYRLVRKLGEGSVGLVYMAEDEVVSPPRQVALKVLKAGMDSRRILARFELERRVLQRMNHPDIAQFLDAGMSPQGRPFFVLEWVDGRPLSVYCEEEELGLEARIRLMIRVCRAVEHAHQKGIIHRDLKPSNILVVSHAEAVPKIIDFGISKVVRGDVGNGDWEEWTATVGGMLGTPSYMSPEQASESVLDVDTRADVYALGVLLYELLVGKPPLDAGELMRSGVGWEGLRRRILLDEVVKPSTRLESFRKWAPLGKELPGSVSQCLGWCDRVRGDLDWIVLRAISKERTRRYSTVGGLALDLERHLSSQPVEACPPTMGYVLGRFMKRNRLAVFSASLLTLLLVAGLLVTGWQWRRAVESERVQNQLREQAEHATLQALKRSYAADMKLASLALDAGHLGRARSLLEPYRPGESNSPALERRPDLRGMEWHWLNAGVRGGELKSFNQQRMVTAVRASPGGEWVAASSFQGDLMIWGLNEGALLHRFPGPVRKNARQSLDLTRDGRWMLFVGREGVELIDTAQWQVTQIVPGVFWGMELSSDNTRLALLTLNEVRVLKFPEMVVERVWSLNRKLRMGEGELHWVGEQKDRLLVMEDGGCRVWDVAEGRVLWEPGWKVGDGTLVSSALDPTGRWLLQGSQSGTLRMFDLMFRREVLEVKGHSTWVMDMEFSADGRLVVTAGGDQTARLWEWDAERLALEPRQAFQGHQNEVWAVALTRDGRHLVSGGKDATVKWWAMEKGTSPVTVEYMLDDLREPLGFTEDGSYFMYRTHGHALRFLGVESGVGKRPDVEVLRGGGDPNEFWRWKVVLTRSRLLLLKPQGELEMRRVPGDEWERSLKLDPVPDAITQVSQDGRWLAGIQLGTGEAFVWDLKSGKRVLKLEGYSDNESTPRGNRFSFSPDSRYLAYSATGFKVTLVEVETGRTQGQFVGHAWSLYSLRFSPDGRKLTTTSWDGTVGLWNVADFRLSVPLLKGHFSGVDSARFSPDGRTLVSCGGEGMLKLWNVETGIEMFSKSGVRSDSYDLISPTGRRLVWREKGQETGLLKMAVW